MLVLLTVMKSQLAFARADNSSCVAENNIYRVVLCSGFHEYIDYEVKSPTLLFINSWLVPDFVVVST